MEGYKIAENRMTEKAYEDRDCRSSCVDILHVCLSVYIYFEQTLSHTTHFKVDALPLSNRLTCKNVNIECSDDHILKISQQLEKWELVATRLGLTAAEIEAIEYNNRNIEMMRLNCLKKWKSKALLSGTATYQVLLQALLDCGCNDQAKQVCSLLNTTE